jgi:phosphatidylglycerophosphatase A
MINKLSRFLATGFYSGYAPIAPGTAGSAVAWLIFILIPGLRDLPLLLLIVLVFFIGVKVATDVEKTDGHDASVIVIDEMVGMWVSLLILPVSMSWTWWIAAFFLFRFFDIIKPFPAGKSQKLPAGWGIMMDDLFAGLYANLAVRLIFWLFSK